MASPALVLAALVAEACLGYSARLQRWLPHPVAWIGAALSALERRWNHEGLPRKKLGVLTLAIVAGGASILGAALQIFLLNSGVPGRIALVLIATTGLAQRSLYDHVRAVSKPLLAGDIAAARVAVGRIVGRDTQALDEQGIAGAALESLAESFNDGVVAPAFWLFAGGLGGLFAYKAVNTADSMIGHLEPRWRDFGWAAARTDDVLNLIPARLAGGLLAIAGFGGWRVMWNDARKHASPNAGWPEAAMAGALDIRLGGPACYDGVFHDRPMLGAGDAPDAEDVQRGLRIFAGACALLWLIFAAGDLSWPR